jgi:hypothetical protein
MDAVTILIVGSLEAGNLEIRQKIKEWISAGMSL